MKQQSMIKNGSYKADGFIGAYQKLVKEVVIPYQYSVLNDEWDCVKKNPYKDISFEREARFSEKDPHYLENSRYFAWLKEI